MPSAEEFQQRAQRLRLKRPTGMAEWQFARVQELYNVGGDTVSTWAKAMEAGNRREYERLIREILATPPRYWKGWSIQDDLLIWYLYRDLPAGSGAGPHQSLLAGMANAGYPNRGVISSTEHGSRRVLAKDQGLAWPHVLLS
jgi:hypothetical protein